MKYVVSLLAATYLIVAIAVATLSPSKEEIMKRVIGPSVQVAYFEGMGGAVSSWKTAGSGTVFKCEKGTFVITAGHVISGAREEIEEEEHVEGDKNSPQDSGARGKKYKFNDVVVIVQREKDGVITGELRLRAKVIGYSPEEERGGDDVAVLQPYEGDLLPYGALPLPPDAEVYPGQHVYHVGSLLGELVNSVSFGVIASTSRMYKNKPFIQLDTTALPGSSGGGIFVVVDSRCYYAGILTRGAGETVNLAVPLKRVRETLKRWKMEWILDTAK